MEEATSEFEHQEFHLRLIKRFFPPTVVMILLSSVLYPFETAKKLAQVSGSIGHIKGNTSFLGLLKSTSLRNLYKGYHLHVLKLTPF